MTLAKVRTGFLRQVSWLPGHSSAIPSPPSASHRGSNRDLRRPTRRQVVSMAVVAGYSGASAAELHGLPFSSHLDHHRRRQAATKTVDTGHREETAVTIMPRPAPSRTQNDFGGRSLPAGCPWWSYCPSPGFSRKPARRFTADQRLALPVAGWPRRASNRNAPPTLKRLAGFRLKRGLGRTPHAPRPTPHARRKVAVELPARWSILSPRNCSGTRKQGSGFRKNDGSNRRFVRGADRFDVQTRTFPGMNSSLNPEP